MKRLLITFFAFVLNLPSVFAQENNNQPLHPLIVVDSDKLIFMDKDYTKDIAFKKLWSNTKLLSTEEQEVLNFIRSNNFESISLDDFEKKYGQIAEARTFPTYYGK